MGIKLILSIFTFTSLLSCSTVSTNFKVETSMKEVVFKCPDDYDINSPLFEETYLDTVICFQIINRDDKDLFFFHDKTFPITYDTMFRNPPNESNTIIRYFDENKHEIRGRFSSVRVDPSSVASDFYIELVDTITYKIRKFDTLSISQKLKLPYFKYELLITIHADECKKVHFIKFCIGQGKKKKKNKLYGFECSDFIRVIHK